MAKMIYNAVELLYGGGLADEVAKFMKKMWQAVSSLSQSEISNGYSIFSAVAAALLVLYFYMDIASQASRDLLTLEKLTVFCVKFIVAFVILLNVSTFMNGFVSIGQSLWNTVSTNTKSIGSNVTSESEGRQQATFDEFINANPGDDDENPGYNKKLLDAIETEYPSGIKGFFKAFDLLLPCLVVWLVGTVLKFLCYFAVIKNALEIVVRGYLSPLAIPQLFEEGQRSAGIRYIKAFAAVCLEMMVMIVFLRLGSNLAMYIQNTFYGVVSDSGQVISGALFVKDGNNVTCYPTNIAMSLNMIQIIMGLLPNVVAVTAAQGAGKITREIAGA